MGMRVHALGAEVGASGLLLEAAGICPGALDPFPDPGRVQVLGGVDAIVVTHAADHIGALPSSRAPSQSCP